MDLSLKKKVIHVGSMGARELGLFFRCMLRVARCELCTAWDSLQYFNPEPGTRNSKRLQFAIGVAAGRLDD